MEVSKEIPGHKVCDKKSYWNLYLCGESRQD
jgi:hypothetical protein